MRDIVDDPLQVATDAKSKALQSIGTRSKREQETTQAQSSRPILSSRKLAVGIVADVLGSISEASRQSLHACIASRSPKQFHLPDSEYCDPLALFRVILSPYRCDYVMRNDATRCFPDRPLISRSRTLLSLIDQSYLIVF